MSRKFAGTRSMFAVTGLLIICGAALSHEVRAQQGPPPTPVRVAEVRREPIQQRVMVTGDLRAAKQSNVATREVGLVAEMHVEEGERVQAGDLLAELDAKLLEIELSAIEGDRAVAEAVVVERRAELEQNERDLTLLKQSFERSAANPKELYDAEAAVAITGARLAQAERRVEIARARAELLRARIEDMRIVAPFDGVIISKLADRGEWLGEGDAIVELISIDPIQAWLNVPQSLRAAVGRSGLSVSARVDATGEVRESSELRAIPMVDPRARTFTLIANLENGELVLAPGMSVTAWVPTEAKSDQLIVPKDAVLRADSGAFVYVARSMGAGQPPSAVMVRVTERFPMGPDVVVQSSELNADDLVVVEGNERLLPMTPLNPIRNAAAAATEPVEEPTQ